MNFRRFVITLLFNTNSPNPKTTADSMPSSYKTVFLTNDIFSVDLLRNETTIFVDS